MEDATEVLGSVNGKPPKPLTQRQEEFCQFVVEGASLSEAYRQSHHPQNMKDKTVWEKASRLHALGKVQTRIRELQVVGKQKVEYDHARWLEEIQRIAFFDVRKLFDPQGNPVNISDLPAEVVQGVAGLEIGVKGERRYKLTNKLTALELFGKATGYYQEKATPPLNALETASTEVLLTMLEELKQRKAARTVSYISHS